MSSELAVAEPQPITPPKSPRRRHQRGSSYTSMLAHGEPLVWLTGGALAVALVMIIGLLATVLYHGIGTFWPDAVVQLRLQDGTVHMGEITKIERYVPQAEVMDRLAKQFPQVAAEAQSEAEAHGGAIERRLIRIGNFEITGNHFVWVDEPMVAEESLPEWSVVFERMTWGRFYGKPERFIVSTPIKSVKEVGDFSAEEGKSLEVVLEDGTTKPAADVGGSDAVTRVNEIWTGESAAWNQYEKYHAAVRDRWAQILKLNTSSIGAVNQAKDSARLEMERARLDRGLDSEEFKAAEAEFKEVETWEKTESARINSEIQALSTENDRYKMVVVPASGDAQQFALADIVRAYPANQLSWMGKLGVYFSRWSEFLTDNPREANSEGGVFPAIWGTVAMTLLMSLLVVPFGVLAALYLREYAKAGPIVSAVRIAINNLAGVPSVVFGVFGLGFFCYNMGHFIDVGPQSPMPPGKWWLTAAVLAVASVSAFYLAISLGGREAEKTALRYRVMRWSSVGLWLLSFALAVTLVVTTPYFEGFFRTRSVITNTPTYGTGGLMWASFTLALLTLPVVIVATEESLAAVPNSMREGSYACGASKWQTIRRIVLPRALPGIMTGMILAMARGAGEVAPLMLVGVVKQASLPFDGTFPFVHPERSFMHLGFHIYDVGFQSPNSEAAKPMVYTTTLLLIGIIAFLNVAAVSLRTRLRRRFVSTQF